MRGFALLVLAVSGTLGTTLTLDLYQGQSAQRGKGVVVFASMWATGEPLQRAYEQLFRRFERRYPGYRVEARWDGRWVLPAVRPRLLTGSDVPDIINTDRESLQVLVDEGYLVRLDALLDRTPHPDDTAKPWREAFDPRLLARCHFTRTARSPAGIYLAPAGVWLHLVFYNQLHYRRLGLAVPETWAELMENARRLRDAGITPFVADGSGYAGLWPETLLPLAVGEQTLARTITSASGLRFDRDPRYRAVFAAIRQLHRPGFFPAGWTGSRWPAAQRAWIHGEGTHIINGSWLLRETRAYDPDPRVVELGAFPLPRPPGPTAHHSAVFAEVPGYGLLRQARQRRGAVALLRFLSERQSASLLARVGQEIPAVRGARFPAELVDLRRQLQQVEVIFSGGVPSYAPGWNRFVFQELFTPFFVHNTPEHPEYLPVDAFLRQLQRRTDRYNETRRDNRSVGR